MMKICRLVRIAMGETVTDNEKLFKVVLWGCVICVSALRSLRFPFSALTCEALGV
jgi:hypothetical protein